MNIFDSHFIILTQNYLTVCPNALSFFKKFPYILILPPFVCMSEKGSSMRKCIYNVIIRGKVPVSLIYKM